MFIVDGRRSLRDMADKVAEEAPVNNNQKASSMQIGICMGDFNPSHLENDPQLQFWLN
jgi:hypothetical protein